MNNRRTVSFKRRSVQIVAWSVLPVVLCLLAWNFYILESVLRTSTTENAQKRLESLCLELEEKLPNIDRYMLSQLTTNSDFNVLRYRSTDRELFESTQSIIIRYNYILRVYPQITGFLLYSRVNDGYYRFMLNTGAGYISSLAARDYLAGRIERGDLDIYAWHVDTIDGREYALRLMGYSEAMQMCFIDIERLLADMNASLGEGEVLRLSMDDQLFEGRKYVYLDEDGRRMTAVRYESDILFAPFVLMTPFRLSMTPMQVALIVATFVFLLALLPLGILFYNRMLLHPIEQMTDTMDRIRQGSIDERPEYTGSILEYDRMSRAFSDLMDEIHALTIRSYEEAMKAQRTELQFLHLQIRPHFYLNNLKILYGLAELKDYVKIQQLILLLSDYLRGIMNGRSMVTIGEELKHVATYTAITDLCGTNRVHCVQTIDERMANVAIPSLTILTFVENAVNHGRLANRDLTIRVRIQAFTAEEREYVNISVSDNGSGFDEATLAALNHPDMEQMDQRHIGIYNIRSRLALTYGNRASLAFFNVGGALVELFLPLEVEVPDDAIDC